VAFADDSTAGSPRVRSIVLDQLPRDLHQFLEVSLRSFQLPVRERLFDVRASKTQRKDQLVARAERATELGDDLQDAMEAALEGIQVLLRQRHASPPLLERYSYECDSSSLIHVDTNRYTSTRHREATCI